jgi:hypothetical protein
MKLTIMGFDDFFGFDEAAYKNEISLLTEEALRREHAIIRQKCLASKASIGLGAFSAAHTGGTSLIFCALGARRNHYNEEKRDIITQCMADEGWMKSKMRKRDILMAVGPSAVAATVAPGLDHVIGGLAGHGASAFASHNAAELASQAIHHTAPLAHAIGDGITAQVSAMAQGLAGHAVPLAPVDSIATCTTQFFGNMAGQALASTAEIAVTKTAARQLASLALDKYANPEIDPAQVHRDKEKGSSWGTTREKKKEE